MQLKQHFNKKRDQRGLSLIEASMVLALAAIVVAGAVMFYQSASESRKAMDAGNELAAIQTAVVKSMNGSSDYASLQPDRVIADSSITPSMKNVAGTQMLNPWGGNVTIAAAAGSQAYTVTMDNLPKTACDTLASQQIGGSLIGLATSIPTAVAGGSSVQPKPGYGASVCTAANDKNTLVWALR